MTGLDSSAMWHIDDDGPTLADIGETSLLEQLMAIAAACASTSPSSVQGDDAAIIAPPAGTDIAMSIDAAVEDVDFVRSWLDPAGLGRRAFNAAASDMAAMGAVPRTCLITICAAPAEAVADVLDIQRGLCAAAAATGCAVVGGDVSTTRGPLIVDVCVTGELPAGRALRRDAGRPGDVLLVTGTLGRAAAGLRLLRDGVGVDSADEQRWLEAQRQAGARIAEGRSLLERGVRCAGDLSDGLLVDTARIARSSGCAAELWVDRLPVDAGLRDVFAEHWLQLAVAGGEDFELLAAAAESTAVGLLDAWPAEHAPLTVVGRLVSGAGVRLLDDEGGIEVTAPPFSSRHFG